MRHTIKLVIIGASGVGKTSLRNRFTTNSFNSSYRATIGADFVSKTLTIDGEEVVLQIWDTAGQSRFAPLVSAFYRGADAVILTYAVTSQPSLHALAKFWDDFSVGVGNDNATVVAVGTKVDVDVTAAETVLPEEARAFLGKLIPPAYHASKPSTPEPIQILPSSNNFTAPTSSHPPATFRYGTMSTVRTGLSVYHTPEGSTRWFGSQRSSVYGDGEFHSARASPEPSRTSSSYGAESDDEEPSNDSTSTIMPAISGPSSPPHFVTSALLSNPSPPYTSVPDIFEYIARHVLAKREHPGIMAHASRVDVNIIRQDFSAKKSQGSCCT